MLSRNLILQMHDEEIYILNVTFPGSGPRLVFLSFLGLGFVGFFFLFGLIVAFKALPWFVFQSWLLIVLSQGGIFSEK